MRVKQGPEACPETVLWAAVAIFYVWIALHPFWKFVEVCNSDCPHLAVVNDDFEGVRRLYAGNCRRCCFGLKHHSGLHVLVRAGRVPLRSPDRALFFRRMLREDIAQTTP